ncbi:MAG: MFS transporter [Candidatus Binatia bacterium]
MTRTERTYYLVFGLYSLWAWFVAPIYPLFLRSRGLDALEVNLVLATYLIIVFVFEVPTGAAADLVGRKASFLLSCALRAVAFGLYAVAQSFTDCVIAELIDGIGTTLASGALDAWAIDGMRDEGDNRPVERFFARAQTLARVGMILGGLVCAYLAAVDFALPWWVAAAGFAATGAVGAAVMRERPRAASAGVPRRHFVTLMGEGFHAVRGVPVLVLVCALTGASYFAAIPAHMLWQQRMIDLSGEGVWIVGWLWVALNLAAVAGSAVLPGLLERLRRSRVLFLAALWRGCALAFAALAATLAPALGGWLLQEVSFGLSEPVMQAWMNEHVAADRRATVLSIRSMVGTLGGGAGLIAIGFVARDQGVGVAWMVSAVLFLVTAPAYLLLERLAAVAPVSPRGAEEVPAPIAAKVAPPALT